MVISRSAIIATIQWLLFFAYFGGYYAILTVVANTVGNDASRFLTVPLRVLILLLAAVLLYQSLKLKLSHGLFYALLFSIAYVTRISVEMLDYGNSYHISDIEFLLYYLAFFMIPLSVFSQIKFVEADYQRILHGILFGCFILALLTIIFYGSLIGQVGRLTASVEGTTDYISPLALSYVSLLGFVVAMFYITTNVVRGRVRLYILAGAGLCLIPFFLGASRGSVFAGAGAFLFYLAFASNVKKRVAGFLAVTITTGALFLSQSFLGTGVFDRVFSIKEDIESGSSSASRLEIWSESLRQFLENPLFGNSLESEYVSFHPHNIFIEILISTGLIGFVPFVLFIGYVIAKSIRITRQAPQYYWMVCVFLIGLIQHQFSGAIYGASWVAMGAALVLGFRFTSKTRNSFKRRP